MGKDIKVEVDNVIVNYATTHRKVEVALEGVDLDAIIKELDEGDILDAIGRRAAINHFGIEEAEG